MSFTVRGKPIVWGAVNPAHMESYGSGVAYSASTLEPMHVPDVGAGFVFHSNFANPGDDEKVLEAIDALTQEIFQLRSAIEALSRRLSDSERRAKQSISPASKKRRKIVDKDAKLKIKEYFEARHGETIYPSDVADELSIDYDTAVRLVRELEEDGHVARA